MDLLEHPWEAVAFRLYSLPIPEAASAATGAAAAWTCLAAVLAAAAAAGLWHLRSSTPAVAVAVSMKPLQLDPSRAAEVSSPEPPSRPSLPAAAASTTPTAAPSPKERYTAYYRDAGCVGCCDVGSDEDGNNDEEEDDDADEEHEDGDRDVFVSDGADPFGREVVRSLRPLSPTAAAEMGRRYRRSPTAALSNGSVVQLWDHGAGAGAGGGLTTPMASPRRRGRVVVGAVSAF